MPSIVSYLAGVAACACIVAAGMAACTGAASTGPGDAGIESGSRDTSVHEAASEASHADAVAGEAGDGGAASPTLQALGVRGQGPLDASADASSPFTLVPSFSPSTHDYYVRCGPGTNVLNVSMTASPGAESALTQPIVSSQAPTQTLSIGVVEGHAIVAVASQGQATTQYWVRCLPSDFPELQMQAHAEAGAAPPGYYLVGNMLEGISGGYAMVLNGDGVPVWFHASVPGAGAGDVDSLVAGAVSFIPTSAGIPQAFVIDHLSPASTTTVAPTGYTADTHELRVLPNGDYLLFTDAYKSGVDLTGLALPTADGGVQPLGPGSAIVDCMIAEVAPSGAVVHTWRASDHFDPAKVSLFPMTGVGLTSEAPDGGTVYDVFHCNSIEIDAQSGDLVVSARQMHSIFAIAWPTGNVVWKMGGADSSLDDAAYVAVDAPFFFQHDARLQPGWSSACGGSGQISLFDDESLMLNPARGVVYDVVVGAPDGGGGCDAGAHGDGGAGGTATLAWQYKGSVSSLATGSFRIAADGSRVIGWGLGGAPGLAFTEVDIKGGDLLDFYFPDGNTTYRAIKVPLTAFDLDVLRATAGGP